MAMVLKCFESNISILLGFIDFDILKFHKLSIKPEKDPIRATQLQNNPPTRI